MAAELGSFRYGSSMRHYALLILICLAAFLPGIASLPPIDRDEPRFVQASKQMAEGGDYIDIRFQGESRYKKPIGIYWLQSAAVEMAGGGAAAPIWAYRLVSVLGGLIAVCATFAIGRSLFGEREGLIAAIALAGIFGLAFEARIAKTDAFLLATAVVAQGALAGFYLAMRKGEKAPGRTVWLFWIAEAVAILIKGPIVPLLSALTVGAVAAFDRDWRWLRGLKPIRGLVLVLLIVAPWIIAISLKGGWAFWQESVGKDMMGKVASGQESHGFPPGYYVLTYSLFLWPFGAMALEGGLAALRRFRSDPRLLFLLCWYLPWWIVCELMPTKLPHYVLPAYPALLLLMAWHLNRSEGAEAAPSPPWMFWLVWIARVGVIAVTVALAALAVGLPLYFDGFSAWSIPSAIAFVAAGWLGSGIMVTWQPLRRVVGATLASMVGMGLLAGQVLPSLDQIWLGREVARAYSAAKPCADSKLASAGYDEPSLVFLTATDTLLTDGAGAAAWLKGNRCGVAAVERVEEPAFQAAFNQSAAKPIALSKIQGLNFSNGRAVSVTLYRLPFESQ
ncbi:glycosyltransferase family 39 protein [Mesorhizobium sp. BAC0120]|uniref:ArnT family glycosyltransferase n=1 Tax=Mesorhizobium sp. BAC0120 TaxID=3090670 RepID=UPI00298D3147|nr:glycosyltransferase family 39 protein [Mesorhizobium sp. BAC0120]MDW6026220.1 glycosyltransferase family 39 protein [Mesorhizobium sp. BAC0120]